MENAKDPGPSDKPKRPAARSARAKRTASAASTAKPRAPRAPEKAAVLPVEVSEAAKVVPADSVAVDEVPKVSPPAEKVTVPADPDFFENDSELSESGPEPVAEIVPVPVPEPEPEPEPEPVAVPVASGASKRRTESGVVLRVRKLTKKFDDKIAVAGIDLEVKVGAFYGIVGPNGAGKTTTLSMITGLLRPTAGSVQVHGADVWRDPVVAKRNMGVLPDRLRLFDRLTGGQVLFYAGVLRGLDEQTVRRRTADLAAAFGFEEALGRLVNDYSAGMTKKVALASAMIHSPRVLVLDEPFESVDPVSAATVTEILKSYVDAGGTVLLSSHSMDMVQRICDNVAVVVNGVILADGAMDDVRAGATLEERFVELAGGRKTVEGLEWLHNFSD